MASLSLRPQGNPFKLIGLALLAVTIAGCVPRPSGPATPPPPEIRPTAPEGPSRLPPDETRNRVAVLVPLSGPNAALGQSLLNAANLALFDTGGQRIRISASFGVATLVDGRGLEQLIKLADAALYVAKERGRNRVEAGG